MTPQLQVQHSSTTDITTDSKQGAQVVRLIAIEAEHHVTNHTQNADISTSLPSAITITNVLTC